MVGHNHPGREFVKVSLALACQYGLRHKIGDCRILQPQGPPMCILPAPCPPPRRPDRAWRLPPCGLSEAAIPTTARL